MAKPRKKPRKDKSPDSLFAVCAALSLAGLLAVAAFDETDYRTGQRVVSVAEQRKRAAVMPVRVPAPTPAPAPVVLWKTDAREIALADLTPGCEDIENVACVLGESLK